jgi:hypothetical protein
VRNQPLIGRRFGIGGRRVPLVRRWKSHAVEAERGVGRSLKHKFVSWLRRREIHALDKLLGVAEMARAMKEGRPQPLPPDFLTHLNELTLLIQRAGTEGVAVRPETTFAPIGPLPDMVSGGHNYRDAYRPRFFEKLSGRLVAALHRK